MSNKFDEMRAAVADAKGTLRAADTVATQMAEILVGRLRQVDSGYTLAALKKELQHFDAHRKCWTEKK